jgi:UDP-N-acetyl-D-glucosamine dehydrogenase
MVCEPRYVADGTGSRGRPGNATFKMKDLGSVTDACTRLAAMLYRGVVTGVRTVSSSRVAELAKLYENAFRNVNIALANEFAMMCRRLDVSCRDVIDAAATKPFAFLHPDFDYAEPAARASLVVDARNATWGLPVPEGRVVRL